MNADGIDEPLQSVVLLYAESQLLSGQTRSFPLWHKIGVANITNGLVIEDDRSVL